MDNVVKNTFSGGLLTDYNKLVTPNTFMTNCLNGTNITFDGNELVLQNDSGNVVLKYTDKDQKQQIVKLKDGYIPVGIKEYNGILYIVSVDNKGNGEIGSYPSPDKESNLEASFKSENLNFPNPISVPLKFIVNYPEDRKFEEFTDKENILRVCDFGEITIDEELASHLNNNIDTGELQPTFIQDCAKTYTAYAKLQQNGKLTDVSELLLNDLKLDESDGVKVVKQKYSIPSSYYGSCIINFERSYPYNLVLTSLPELIENGSKIKFNIKFSASYDGEQCPDGFKFGTEHIQSGYKYNNEIITNLRSILFYRDNTVILEAIPYFEFHGDINTTYLTKDDNSVIHTYFQLRYNNTYSIYCELEVIQPINLNIFCTDVKIVSNFEGDFCGKEQVAQLTKTVSINGELIGLFTLDSFVYTQLNGNYIVNSIIFVDRPKYNYTVYLDILPFEDNDVITIELENKIQKTEEPSVVTYTINELSIPYTKNKYNLVRIYAVSDQGDVEEIDSQYLIQFDQENNNYYTNFKKDIDSSGRTITQILTKINEPTQEYSSAPKFLIDNVLVDAIDQYCIIKDENYEYPPNAPTKLNYTKRITFEAGRQLSDIKVNNYNTILPDIFISKQSGKYTSIVNGEPVTKYIGQLSIENTPTTEFITNDDNTSYFIKTIIRNENISGENSIIDEYAKKTFDFMINVEQTLNWSKIMLPESFKLHCSFDKYNEQPSEFNYTDRSDNDKALFNSVFGVEENEYLPTIVKIKNNIHPSNFTAFQIVFSNTAPEIGANINNYTLFDFNTTLQEGYLFIVNNVDNKVIVQNKDYNYKIYRNKYNSDAKTQTIWACSLADTENILKISNIKTQNVFTNINEEPSEDLLIDKNLLIEQAEIAANTLYPNNEELKNDSVQNFLKNTAEYSINVPEDNNIYYNANELNDGYLVNIDSNYFLVKKDELSVIQSGDQIKYISKKDVLDEDGVTPHNHDSFGNTGLYINTKTCTPQRCWLVSTKNTTTIPPTIDPNPIIPIETSSDTLDLGTTNSGIETTSTPVIKSYIEIMLYQYPEIV